jgi:hypothetical protein
MPCMVGWISPRVIVTSEWERIANLPSLLRNLVHTPIGIQENNWEKILLNPHFFLIEYKAGLENIQK